MSFAGYLKVLIGGQYGLLIDGRQWVGDNFIEIIDVFGKRYTCIWDIDDNGMKGKGMRKISLSSIKENFQEKDNEELISIWVTRSKHNYFSKKHFKAIKEILTERGVPLPATNIQKEMHNLPNISLKKAINIDRRFRAYSSLLLLMMVFGFFHIFENFEQYGSFSRMVKFIEMYSSSSSQSQIDMKPKEKEMLEKLSPHLNSLENYAYYSLALSILVVPVWIMIFYIWRYVAPRNCYWAKQFMVVMAILLVLNATGVILSFPLKEINMNLFLKPVVFVVVDSIFILDLLFLLGKNAQIYSQYTAIDRDCFKKNGSGRDVLKLKGL